MAVQQIVKPARKEACAALTMDSTVQRYRPNQQRVKRIVGTTYLRKVITGGQVIEVDDE